MTVPVRVDGFDPLGDDSRWADLPAGADVALVAGNPAYLTKAEQSRRLAPRLDAGIERAPDARVGTEGIERLALATGATQFELFVPDTERWVRHRREARFERDIVVYAPTVLTDDEDALLDPRGILRPPPACHGGTSGRRSDRRGGIGTGPGRAAFRVCGLRGNRERRGCPRTG